MKLGKVFLVALSFSPALLWPIGLQAQTTETNRQNLYELTCQSLTPQIQNPLKLSVPQADVEIGSYIYDEVAYLHNKYLADFGDVLDSSDYGAEITCQLPAGASRLNLAFGLAKNNNNLTDFQDVVVLEVYGDQKLLDQTYLKRQTEMQQRSLAIDSAQKVTLKATCVNRLWWNNCPRLSFLEMKVD